MNKHSWEPGDSVVHAIARKALENYKKCQDPMQETFYSIAYILALQELRSWREHQPLERIAEALEAGLRGEQVTSWQAEEAIHAWAVQWVRKKEGIPDGQVAVPPEDLTGSATYDHETDTWKATIYLDTKSETYTVRFKFDDNFHLQVLSIELDA